MASTFFTTRPAVGLFYVTLWLSYVKTSKLEPLLLTPYLERNQISEARSLSTVKNNIFRNFNAELPASHAGYITVNKYLGNHMFFWLFRAEKETKSPLLLWLNGFPTSSSMIGLFSENGPVHCSKKDGRTVLKENPDSWTKFGSILYVDNPIGTGFSYSDRGYNGQTFMQDDITDELYSFLGEFFKMFPEFKSNDFFIGGRSYAGKFVPHLAHHIHKKRKNGYTDIPLTGIYLGGPLFDPITQLPLTYDYLYSVGRISFISYKDNKDEWNRLISASGDGLKEWTLDDLWVNLIAIEGINVFNYAAKDLDNSCITEVMSWYYVKKAIHAGSTPFRIRGRSEWNNKFMGELFKSRKSELAVLLDNYKVLVYNGDNDVIASPVMTEAALLSTPWYWQSQYNTTQRSVWYGDDKKTVQGYYSKTGQFCRVVVRGAGHYTPYDQPKLSLEMMKRFVNHGCI